MLCQHVRALAHKILTPRGCKMTDAKLNAALNRDLRMGRLGPRAVRREPPRYVLPDGPVCAAPTRARRLVDESTAIGLREAGAVVRLTRAEALGIVSLFLALVISAALIGYANGVADATLRHVQQEVAQGM